MEKLREFEAGVSTICSGREAEFAKLLEKIKCYTAELEQIWEFQQVKVQLHSRKIGWLG
jgi:hypothetical protein